MFDLKEWWRFWHFEGKVSIEINLLFFPLHFPCWVECRDTFQRPPSPQKIPLIPSMKGDRSLVCDLFFLGALIGSALLGSRVIASQSQASKAPHIQGEGIFLLLFTIVIMAVMH